jgi:hypothetical protein
MTLPRRIPWITIIAVASVGCGDLTHVSNPDVTSPSALYSPSGALAYRAGAIKHFSLAFGTQVLESGLVADEFTAAMLGSPVDQRLLAQPAGSNGGITYYPYDLLQTALIGARQAAFVLNAYNPTPATRIGQLYAFAGYIELFFAENMCSGIPIATMSGGYPGATQTLSTSQLLQGALADFDSAAARTSGDAADSTQIISLLAVGRARALLDSGDVTDAQRIATTVPASFVYPVTYDGTIVLNPVYQAIADYRDYTVSNVEGQNGLDFRSGDPRLQPIQDIGVGTDNIDTLFLVGTAMAADSSTLVLASGVEAALIRAEADLRQGSIGAWASELNALRAGGGANPMTPLPPDSTTSASPSLQQQVMFRERAFWLFASGHRQGDLRRLVRQYGLSPNQVFPTGSYKNGQGAYGSGTDFIPFGEVTNSAYHGCMSTAP